MRQYAEQYRQMESDGIEFWASKRDQLFWRGSRLDARVSTQGGNIRSKAVDMFRGDPGADVEFVQWSVAHVVSSNNRVEGCAGLLDHCAYRYLAFLDGHTYSSRLKYQLLCGAAVLAQEQSFVEWFTHTLVSGEHFVEVQAGWEDAPSVLVRLRGNPEEVFRIAQEGQRYAMQAFSQDSVDCYWREVLLKAAAISEPEPLPATARLLEDILLAMQ
mmetsp:Transcript_69831/g.227183  ORF Transcript_69831/g.227183 Transcript_69831/m.227183 type:complete len:215 (+) Transcript_69831:401-1045(+)